MNLKSIVIAVLTVVLLITFIALNPFSWNDAGNRTVVERTDGTQIVQFAPGIFTQVFAKKGIGQIKFL
ncbi:MAG: hypothetical protein HC836_15790 [Richelia sp. RM2_1_2]|nr:hypothetical protein [Richelia sp. RM2_1_2]